MDRNTKELMRCPSSKAEKALAIIIFAMYYAILVHMRAPPVILVLSLLPLVQYLDAESDIIVYEDGILAQNLCRSQFIPWKDITGVYQLFSTTSIYTKGFRRLFFLPRLQIGFDRPNRKEITALIKNHIR